MTQDKQAIRIGSQSKSEVLTELDPRVVARIHDSTKLEKRERWHAKTSIEEYANHINEILRRMRVAVSDTGIMHYLKEIGVDYHRQLLGVYVDDEGFVEVTSDHEPRSLRVWLHGGRRTSTRSLSGI